MGNYRSALWMTFKDVVVIVRYHIMLVAMVGALTFGWLITGRYLWSLCLIVGIDWLLINLFNRITDVDEDFANGIQGTKRVAQHKNALIMGCIAVMALSFAITHSLSPGLTRWRAALQLVGLGYNYKIIPTTRGFIRFKELYFLKNFASATLFVITCFAYPLVSNTFSRILPWGSIIILIAFFLPFEITYEILYDFRDIRGDLAAGIATFPVVHGLLRARQILDALLVCSALVLTIGVLRGILGLREGLLIVAPLTQFAFYRSRLQRGLSSHDCIVLTHLGTVQLLVFLGGTAVWARLGLPANVFL